MTIEKLEALEKAVTAGPFTMMGPRTDETATVEYDHVCLVTTPPRDGMVEIAAVCDNVDRARLFAAARNALPALLAVAKAAKAVARWTEQEPYGTIKMRDDTCANNALAELCEALSRLEAQ